MKFRDLLPWWRRNADRLQDARRIEADSTSHLEAAHERASRVRSQSAWVQYTWQRNHLTQRFEQYIGKGHS